MKLHTISEIINAKPSHKIPDVVINWLLTDSRSLSFPAESLFFAIETKRNDGHKYIAELYKQNARYFLVSKMLPDFSELPDAVFLQVNDTLEALQTLTSAHRRQFDIPIVGITGSNGKTIIKEWLYQLLHTDYNITRSPRSYNSQIGVPLSVWRLAPSNSPEGGGQFPPSGGIKGGLGIFEAGISEPNEMARLQAIIQPTIGIFTNLGDAHQENFSSYEQKAQEKMKLFTDVETLIYNKDNDFLDKIILDSGIAENRLFSWGKSENADVRILKIEKSPIETEFSVQYQNEFSKISIPFTDDASIENALHCIAFLLFLGKSFEEIASRISRLEPVAMRLEVKEGIRNCLILNDSYNSDINSLNIALDFMNQQATAKNLQRTLILSDIMQSGFSAEELYRNVAELVRNKNIHHFIGIGKEVTSYKLQVTSILGESCKVSFFDTTEDFLKSNLINEFSEELILLKGARAFHFERISAKLELIAHETVLEVNLNAFVDNLNYFRAKLHPETLIMSMVKASAYGSGALEIARTLQHHQCDYLAVAVADEGAELRRVGIRIPIVVMNPEKSGFDLIFDHKLEPEIYSFRLLESFIASAEKLGIADYPIHIKIDSGMHRLGFEPQEIEKLIARLQNQTQVKVRSVFSHFAGADDARFDDFTHKQARVFIACADQISRAFSHKILRHILNSSGIERFPEYQFDMVRLGIGHYGVSALQNGGLKPVCSLKTVILQIKNIKAGDTVGYNRSGKVTRDSRIAVIPIGYADGFDRRLGNGTGEVFINGKRAKTIGNICMDLTMIDITDIDAEEGDGVEIFGENISISEVADRMKTIPYEVLTSVSRRVKRVYFQE